MAAQGEEVVRDADLEDAECLREGLAQGAFTGGCRRAASGRFRPAGCGQGATVGLAVGGDGQGGEPHVGRGDHVVGQRRGEVRADLGFVRAVRPVGGHGVGDQPPVAGPVLADDGAGGGDAGQGGERGLDLAELDAEAAELDLVVGAGDVDEFAVGPPAHQVAGAVHAASRAVERVGHETRRGQGGPAVVPTGHSLTGDVQFADDAGWHGGQRVVQDVDAGAVDGYADGHGAVGGERPVRVLEGAHGRADGGLGGSVGVDEEPVPRPGVHQGRRARLAGEDHRRPGGQGAPRHHRECGGRQGEVGDSPFADQGGEGGARQQGLAFVDLQAGP